MLVFCISIIIKSMHRNINEMGKNEGHIQCLKMCLGDKYPLTLHLSWFMIAFQDKVLEMPYEKML